MTTHWFPDNSVIVTFAAIDRLEVLESYLRGSGRVVEAVWYEIGKSSDHVANLRKLDRSQWFGSPVRIEKPSDVQAVNVIRQGAFGASSRDSATLHLGESQTIHVISSWAEFAGSVWITEDRAAYQYAQSRGVIARDTFDVLYECVAFGDLTKADAFAISQNVLELDRPFLRPPMSERDFD